MKRLLLLVLFCIIGLLLGFLIGKKDTLFSPREKELKVAYDTTKKVEVEKNKDVVVNTKFKNDKNLSINVSNIKIDTIKIKFYIKNQSRKDNALVNIKSTYNKDVCDITINPNKIEIDTSKSIPVEIEISIKDLSKMDKDKLDLDISLVASPL